MRYKSYIIYFMFACLIISYFFQIAITHGKCMIPTIKNHSIVLIEPNYYDYYDFKIGDIIIFKDSGKYLCKRIVKIKGNQLWVEGDNYYNSRDSRVFGWIEKGQVRSKVLFEIVGVD